MKLDEIRKQIVIWRQRIAGNSEPVSISPHPSEIILQLLDELHRNLPHDLRDLSGELIDEVAAAVSEWPSLDSWDKGCEPPVLKHIEYFLKLLKGTTKSKQPIEGEWSKPMTKAEMMRKLRIDGLKPFNRFATEYGIKQVGGSRQLWTIRLDNMSQNHRQKLL